MNKVVARFADGRMIKGFTNDFTTARTRFHVLPSDAPAGTKPVEVNAEELKALFFVKGFTGDPAHQEGNAFTTSRPPVGRKIRVVFKDGEVLIGTTQGYQKGRPGFFLVPADAASNIERCYVISAAAQEITFIDPSNAPAVGR